MTYKQELIHTLMINGIIPCEKEKFAHKIADNFWENKAVSIWSYSDIVDCAEENNMKLSDQSVKTILEDLREDLDDVLEGYLFKEEYQEESKVLQADEKDLPLMLDQLITTEGKEALAIRLKGTNGC